MLYPIISVESQIRDRTLAALAKGRMPDYTGCNPHAVMRAFQEVFDTKIKKPWFEYAQATIQLLSDGGVTLREADESKFPTRIRGAGSYLELVMRDGTCKPFTLGPYKVPIEFVE